MAFNIPPLLNMPVAVITDEAVVDRAELQVFHMAVNTWHNQIDRQMGFLNPQFAMPAVPIMPPANAGAAVRVVRLAELRTLVLTLFAGYATAYNTFVLRLAQGGAAPANIPLPQPRPQEMKLPAEFMGKDAASARHFLKQCNNYINQQHMNDDEERVHWTLQLMEGDATQWRDKILSRFDAANLPLYCIDWDQFQAEFRLRWEDPYEANKATIKLMGGTLNQTTSVKKYNDLFNGYLDLSPYDGANGMVLDSYERGLKYEVLNGAMAQRTPNMTFAEIQHLMIQVDETQQRYKNRSRAPGTTPNPTRTVINNPTFNVQTAPSTSTTPAPVRQTTPAVKAEVARQYTKLTPETRAELSRIGACFYCRKPGHMASQCPRRQARVAAITTTAPPPQAQTAATTVPSQYSANVVQTMSSLNPFRAQQKDIPTPAPAYSAPASQDF